MASSRTMALSPSEHSRMRSPGASSRVRVSTSTSASVPSARVTSARLLQPGDVIRIGHTDLLVEARA